MKKNILISIGAVFAGFFFIVITHTTTDFILESVGVLPKGHLNVGTPVILFVLLYRSVFSFAGCYLTARLAPKDPMKHALILGVIGTILSSIGAIVTASMDIAPAWYGWTLVAAALPISWFAGHISARRTTASAS